ncbi:MAG: hypothetical protein F2704_00985 [Actinobacteria bacterium]|uniref:Unannotated protein n=1 Tax=freshwater metagenome TaxID=449393 RepID=A0A6J6L3E6_9ZZZZ|nr:hypothetical protein [Actinomycetota bacterium]MSX24767.1 hypothetical protein [Actinomycetota bacterium]MSY45949.1 hypothetical protein [Actinomycetota bacterium]MSY56825.1 hypothetical protein [Actinomycetota bacterium]MTB00500.1 hypothetical protein [Actinomycetota bacterium]
MTSQEQKPEWFEMAENDLTPRPKFSRGVRIFALSAPLLALGIGFVFAQTQDGAPATASESTVNASATPVTADVPAPGSASMESINVDPLPVAANTSASTVATTASTVTPTTPAPPTAGVSTPPQIAQPPAMGGGEDDGLEGNEGSEHSKIKTGKHKSGDISKLPVGGGESNEGSEGGEDDD